MNPWPPGEGRTGCRPRFAKQAGNLGSGVLRTDLYELTMLQAYFRQRMNGPAVFELFVRKLTPHRNFLLAAGLAQALVAAIDART
jgi:nicotinate phosphoribosyltransferase